MAEVLMYPIIDFVKPARSKAVPHAAQVVVEAAA
jgi:hypothetical protein